jgi:hypothetical protein
MRWMTSTLIALGMACAPAAHAHPQAQAQDDEQSQDQSQAQARLEDVSQVRRSLAYSSAQTSTDAAAREPHRYSRR